LEWLEKYKSATRETVFLGSEVKGYLTQADNLFLMVVRDAGHLVPMNQPAFAQKMIEEFTENSFP